MNNYWTRTEQSLRNHKSLLLSQNFVLKATQGKTQTAFVLGQYSWLPKVIVEFLTKGIKRLEQFSAIHKELCRNRAEEEGSQTAGQVHYDILCSALNKEIGLDVTVPYLPCINGTRAFLQTISSILDNGSEANVAGAIYALESSAVPELLVIAEIINRYQPGTVDLNQMRGRRSIKDIRNSKEYSLNDFFVLHIRHFEIGHESGLRAAITKDFNESHLPDFDRSFEEVLNAMDVWWLELSKQ